MTIHIQFFSINEELQLEYLLFNGYRTLLWLPNKTSYIRLDGSLQLQGSA